MMNDIKKELNNEKSTTENGAIGYKTTGNALLDINYKVSSLRKMSEDDIYNLFINAFLENKLYAIKWLFFMRDVRGGLGERRSFRVIVNRLAYNYPLLAKQLISIIPEYGRFDDLWCLLDTDLRDDVVKYCYLLLLDDIKKTSHNKPISLLAKWLPSYTYNKSTLENSPKKRQNNYYAKILMNGFNLSVEGYCKTLKKLRRYLDVVECKMSENRWDAINYSTVPSKANLIYSNAFMRNDQKRRLEFLESLKDGNNKINASVLFPHDIVHKYTIVDWFNVKTDKYDESIEQIWKSLPHIVNNESTICVRDDSVSMSISMGGKSNVTALEIATSLSIYFSETLTGEYKNKYISFSSNPKFIDMSQCKSLKEKLDLSYTHSEVSNTDIYKVFKLILDVAIKNNYKQEDLPNNILILSDMEFDEGVLCKTDNTLFDRIQREYAESGYNLPKLIFWNICGRTNVVPIKENDKGVILVSGFSINIIKMIMNGENDPLQCLIKQLNSLRYDLVEEAYVKYEKQNIFR